jgi:methylglutaconyl-CoA hydratase
MRFLNIAVETDGVVARVTLNRPEVRNAFDDLTIAELAEYFTSVTFETSLRAILLQGAGDCFCAGADVTWMQRTINYSEMANVQDAQKLSLMLRAVNDCPIPVIARVQGAALGGGAGLIACCDIVVAADDAKFGFTEAKLGIVPAVISPFVMAKIGTSYARALFMTAQRFSAETALRIGLIHAITPPDAMDSAVEEVLREIRSSGPMAVKETKRLLARVVGQSPKEAFDFTTRTIARVRTSPEGQEGLRAFLDKRKPSWMAEDGSG